MAISSMSISTMTIWTRAISSMTISSMSILSMSMCSMAIGTMSISSMSSMSCIAKVGWSSSIHWGGHMGSISYWGNVLDSDRGDGSSVRAGDDSSCWGAGSGTWFIGLDGGTESVGISNVFDASGSSVNVVDGICTLFVAVGVSNFGSGVAGTESVLDVVAESVVAISLK